MSEAKKRKIAVGATVGGVLLLFCLLIILIIQFVQIGVKRAQNRALNENIQRLHELIEQDEIDLDYFETQDALYREALARGWKSNH